jgi:CHAT domain-containing protein
VTREHSSHSRLFWTAASLAAAAVIVVGIRVVRPGWLAGGSRPELKDLIVALSNEPTRPVEGRLTGGFKYAPPPTPRRGTERELSPELRIAAARLEMLAKQRMTPDVEEALGVAYISIGDLDRAIVTLSVAAAQARSSAILADLAAAYLARRETDDDARALDAAERAATTSPSCEECWFNVALSWERLNQPAEARSVWERSLQLSGAGPWADEIRQRLDRLTPARTSETVPSARSSIRAARRRFEQESIAAWARAVTEGDETRISRALSSAMTVASSIASETHDRFQLDAARALSETKQLDARTTLAQGYLRFAQAVEAQHQDRVGDAVAAYRESAALLAYRSPFADLAELIWLSLSNEPDADQRLDEINRRAATASWLTLVARTRQVQALRRGIAGDFAHAIPLYVDAIATFDRIGDNDGLVMTNGSLAEAYDLLNDPSTAWLYRRRALDLVDLETDRPVRYAMLASVVRGCLMEGLDASASAFQDTVLRTSESWSTRVTQAQNLIRRAQLRATLGRSLEALEDFGHAKDLAEALPDPAARAPIEADLRFGMGQLLASPAARVAALDDAIGVAATARLTIKLPRMYRARAESLAASAHYEEAREALGRALALLETQRRAMSDAQLRLTSFEDSWRTYLDAIRLEVRAGKMSEALVLSERGRDQLLGSKDGVVAGDIERVREALGAGSAIISYVVADDSTYAWVIRREGVVPIRLPIDRARLDALVAAGTLALGRSGDWNEPARRLFDALVRPLLPAIGGATRLFVVPDGPIALVPFEGLLDGQQLMVERAAVAFVPSVNAWRVLHDSVATRSKTPVGTAVAVGNPTVDRRLYTHLLSLPQAVREVEEIGRTFPGAVVLSGNAATKEAFQSLLPEASIVHYAGHAVANRARPLMSHLLLAGHDDQEGSGLLFGYEIARMNLSMTRLVVLSGCSTAVGRSDRGQPVMGLATPFLQAGVPVVVATLWDVDDMSSVRLMAAFYRAVRGGAPVVDALRAARLELLRDDPSLRDHPEKWAGVVAIGAASAD